MTTNNTSKHIADDARYISFNPSNTRFPSGINNVQDAISLTSPTSPATETTVGVIKISTLEEALGGTDNTTAITPLKLNMALQRPEATETRRGVAALATVDVTINGSDDTTIITPFKLQRKINTEFDNRKSTEQNYGVIKISTTTQAQQGTDDTTAITPYKLQQALAVVSSAIISNSATESTRGVVQLATVGQVQQGNIRDGYAISPFTLANLIGNSNSRGIVQAASRVQANQGNDDTVYISAQGFQTYTATKDFYGTVKITDNIGTQGEGIALSASARVLPLSGGNIDGNLSVSGSLTKNGESVLTTGVLSRYLPVGSVTMSFNQEGNEYWIPLDGRVLNISEYPELYSCLSNMKSTTYWNKRDGLTDGTFRIPDLRGLFTRMSGVGQDILNERGLDAKGKNKLGVNVTGGDIGEVQKMQLVKHKHATYYGENWGWRGAMPAGYSASGGKMGSGRSDSDNLSVFTGDGTEIDPYNVRGPINTQNSIDLIGDENRPWNMSLNYLIKAK